MIKAALDLLECGNSESAKALLRAFSGDSATDWPKDGQDMAETRPDAVSKHVPPDETLCDGPSLSIFDCIYEIYLNTHILIERMCEAHPFDYKKE